VAPREAEMILAVTMTRRKRRRTKRRRRMRKKLSRETSCSLMPLLLLVAT
jgi:hypothetical protein